MEYTLEETRALLNASKRRGWTPRLMGLLREEGYLPPLVCGTQSKTNKPRYVWDEEALEQVYQVYDYWEEYKGNRASLTLALWMGGWSVPLEPLKQAYRRKIDTYLKWLTHGETDAEEILDIVSGGVEKLTRKFRYTPGLGDQRKKAEMQELWPILEHLLGALAIADAEMVDEVSRSFFRSAGIPEEEAEDVAEALEAPGGISLALHDIFTLPNLREVLQDATVEQWEQARSDYETFCIRIAELLKEMHAPALPEAPWSFYQNLLLRGAFWLILPLLSARYRGYGQWIDVRRWLERQRAPLPPIAQHTSFSPACC